MDLSTYLNFIETSLKKMDAGFYKETLPSLKKIIDSDFFVKLSLKDQLFIRKRTSWVQLSLGYYEDGWKNFVYNWLKNSNKFEKIKKQNEKIKYLISFDQLKKNENVLIWNDGGFGDFIYQLRLMKFINNNLNFKIFKNPMSYYLRNKDLTTSNAENFEWHLPLNELPRILNYNPTKHIDYKYDYLIKPFVKYTNYNEHIGISYKTETDPIRSMNFKLLKILFTQKKDLKFLVLQKHLDNHEKKFFSSFNNVSYIKDLDDSFIFGDTFNIVNSLKFLISVDTSIGHIAGYLNKKNYLLLQQPSVFYWGFDNKKSVDYNNHIIIRQKTPGDWESVIRDLIELL